MTLSGNFYDGSGYLEFYLGSNGEVKMKGLHSIDVAAKENVRLVKGGYSDGEAGKKEGELVILKVM